ncbi:MAG: hypothetical protein AAF456_06385 [Planctomycetota bacterium]
MKSLTTHPPGNLGLNSVATSVCDGQAVTTGWLKAAAVAVAPVTLREVVN